MTAVINFTPLYGIDENEPFCSLLQIDDCHILLDCGWDDRFDERLLEPLKRVVPKLDAVIISHPDLAHLGALPYAVAKLGLSCPIYSILPVHKMGQMFMYDAFQTASKFDLKSFTLDDIDNTFDKFTQLKYSEDKILAGKVDGITITPYAAGHMIGGTIWKITKETEVILYAVDYNHKKERHLENGVVEAFSRPSVIITDALNADWEQPMRKYRDKQLSTSIVRTLRAGGNVLLPVDSAGRVLEMLQILHALWENKQLGLDQKYSLAFLSHQSYNTVDFARTLIEYMSKKLMVLVDKGNEDPFALKNLHYLHSMEDLERLEQPYVVLASSETMGPGFSQEVFLTLAGDPKNMVLLSSRAAKHTLAYSLLQIAKDSDADSPKQDATVTFPLKRNVPLLGSELREHLETVRLEQEQKELELQNLESDSEDEDMDQGEISRKQLSLTPAFNMYPYEEVKRTYDDYGQVVDAEALGRLANADGVIAHAGFLSVDREEEENNNTVETVEPERPKQPMKTVKEDMTVAVRCKVKYIDFEGRSDGRSVKTILATVAPRKVVLIHGSPRNRQIIKNNLVKNSVCKDAEIFLPKTGQCVDVTSETNIYRVQLTDAFSQSLDFIKLGEYELAYAEGVVVVDYDKNPLPLLEKPVEPHGHPAVLLGDLKMSHLKSVLNRNNIQAEFYGGILVCCNGVVNIRRVSPTQVKLRGGLCEEYFRIRTLLYGLFETL